MNIGKAIRIIRTEQGLTQTELVNRLGYHVHTHISLVETGRVIPSIDKVEKIANALGTTASELVRRAEQL